MEHEKEENTLKAPMKVVSHDILGYHTTLSTELDAEDGTSEQTRSTRHFQGSHSVLHDIHTHCLTNPIYRRRSAKQWEFFSSLLLYVLFVCVLVS